MDLFPKYTGTPGPPPNGQTTNGLMMGYYDGNTVTALWNYAQQFAMSDNSYDTNFGPSTPGAINLISGQTNGVAGPVERRRRCWGRQRRLYADQRRRPDRRRVLDHHRRTVQMGGQNIGDLLKRAASPGASSRAASICSMKNPTAAPAASGAPPRR